MDDPRRVLQQAAEDRSSIEILPRRGAWTTGRVVGVERGGVVVGLTGDTLAAGVDVRAWLGVAGQPYTFEASVLRVGVPVPDRSQGGVLLGFIDGFRRADVRQGPISLAVIAKTGRPVPLLEGDARLVDLHPDHWTVSAPAAFHMVFVEKGELRLQLGVADRAPMEVGARVETLRRGDTHLLYELRITDVEDAERYRDLVTTLRGLLGL